MLEIQVGCWIEYCIYINRYQQYRKDIKEIGNSSLWSEIDLICLKVVNFKINVSFKYEVFFFYWDYLGLDYGEEIN